MKKVLSIATVFGLVFLLACGGGGGSTSGATDEPAVTPGDSLIGQWNWLTIDGTAISEFGMVSGVWTFTVPEAAEAAPEARMAAIDWMFDMTAQDKPTCRVSGAIDVEEDLSFTRTIAEAGCRAPAENYYPTGRFELSDDNNTMTVIWTTFEGGLIAETYERIS